MPSELDNKLQSLHQEIVAKRKEFIELQHQATNEEVADYELQDRNGNTVKLSDLFGEQDELMVIHNMGKGCRYCTLWADGFNGLNNHMSNRMPTILVSPDKPEVMKTFAESRNWELNTYSAANSPFTYELGYAYDKDDKTYYMPGVSALVKKADGKMYRVAKDYFGPGDFYSPVWHLYDLFPKSDDGWQPQYNYS